MPETSAKLLLDTHAWIWLVNGKKVFSAKTLKQLEAAASERRLSLSVISIWEVSLLAAKGKISLSKPCGAWVSDALAATKVSLFELTPDVVIESNFLPGTFHSDPADRIIVATARLFDATVVTRDDKILDYAQKKFVSAIAL